MTKNALSNPVPYEHTPSETTPGMPLFAGALASLLKTMGEDVIPAWLTGVSGFAFRARAQTDGHGHFGTAMWFDWRTVCPAALAQCGWQCTQFAHFQQRGEPESEQTHQGAHTAITTAIEAGTPVLSFSIHDMEWGVIVGYDDDRRAYDVLGKTGMCRWEHEPAGLTYSNLSRNTTHCLHVLVPGQRNGRTRDQVIRNSLMVAIAEAEGVKWVPPTNMSEHWPEQETVVSGPPAFELWAEEIGRDLQEMKAWRDPYGHHIIPARFFARDYLRMIMGEDPDLRQAYSVYQSMVELLMPVWRTTLKWHQSDHDYQHQPYLDKPLELVERIREAGKTEAAAIAALRRYVDRTA